MPEEQSVRAREGAADPQGCGHPLRSGMPFLTLRLSHPRCVVFSHHVSRLLPERPAQAIPPDCQESQFSP